MEGHKTDKTAGRADDPRLPCWAGPFLTSTHRSSPHHSSRGEETRVRKGAVSSDQPRRKRLRLLGLGHRRHGRPDRPDRPARVHGSWASTAARAVATSFHTRRTRRQPGERTHSMLPDCSIPPPLAIRFGQTAATARRRDRLGKTAAAPCRQAAAALSLSARLFRVAARAEGRLRRARGWPVARSVTADSDAAMTRTRTVSKLTREMVTVSESGFKFGCRPGDRPVPLSRAHRHPSPGPPGDPGPPCRTGARAASIRVNVAARET